jgi:hypothetical protein
MNYLRHVNLGSPSFASGNAADPGIFAVAGHDSDTLALSTTDRQRRASATVSTRPKQHNVVALLWTQTEV